MAETIKTILDLFDLLNARIDSDEFQAERKDRLAMLEAARNYFDGKHRRFIKIRKGEKDHNVVINLCKAIVRKSASWLFGDFSAGQTLKFTIKSADNPTGDAGEDMAADEEMPEDAMMLGEGTKDVDPAEQYLEDAWRANGGGQFLIKLARRGGVAGHVFIKVIPKDDPSNGTEFAKLVLLKPDNISVLRRQDDDDEAEAYVIEWVEKRRVIADNPVLQDVRVRQIFAKFSISANADTAEPVWFHAIFNDAAPAQGRTWQVEAEPEAWPFAWCPIVEWQNLASDGYYGESDLEDLPEINDSINFVVSNINKILYTHGHPRTVGTGLKANQLQDTAVDNFWTIENENAKIANLEMQSDLSSAFNFLRFLRESFWSVGRDIDLATLTDKIGQVTNFGLKVLSNDALSKLGEKRLLYGSGLNQVNRILLELGGHEVRDTEPQWVMPLPEDDAAEVGTLQKEVDMEIVSRQTATEERGRDYKQEQARIMREKRSGDNIGGRLLDAFTRGQSFSPLPGQTRRAAMGAARTPAGAPIMMNEQDNGA